MKNNASELCKVDDVEQKNSYRTAIAWCLARVGMVGETAHQWMCVWLEDWRIGRLIAKLLQPKCVGHSRTKVVEN